MLGKLLKYDLKNMYKFLTVFYILSIFFAITTRILFSLEQTVVINVIGQISVGCMFSTMASAIINTLMRNWVRFKETLYSDESYLTHTLPVSKKQIYTSKFVLAFINLFTTLLVVALGLFIAYYTGERWELLRQMLNGASGNIQMPTALCVTGVIAVLFLELFNAVQSGFLGIILGHKKSNMKVGKSVLFGFITYIASQIVVLFMLFLLGVFNKDVMNLFTSTTIANISILKTIMLFSIFVYTAVIVIMYFVALKKLNKGVNVE